MYCVFILSFYPLVFDVAHQDTSSNNRPGELAFLREIQKRIMTPEGTEFYALALCHASHIQSKARNTIAAKRTAAFLKKHNCMHLCFFSSLFTHTHTHTHTHARTHTLTLTRTHTHIHAHSHIFTVSKYRMSFYFKDGGLVVVNKSGPYPDWFLEPFREAGAMNQVLFLDQFNFQKHGGSHWKEHSAHMEKDPYATFSQASTEQIASVIYFFSPHIHHSFVIQFMLVSKHSVYFCPFRGFLGMARSNCHLPLL